MTVLRALSLVVERMKEGQAKYPSGATILSLLDEAGELAHAVNKGESGERVREEILDVAAVALRLLCGDVDETHAAIGNAHRALREAAR